MRLPDEMVGKSVEVIAFEIKEDSIADKVLTPEQRRQKIEALTLPYLVDLSKFTFNRNEANNYEG